MENKNYKVLLPKITTFIFDVDGVLTDGKILVTDDGSFLRAVDTKDGYAMKCALIQGYRIAIISGGTNEAIRERFNALGIEDVYLGAHHKMEAFNDLVKKHQLNPEEILYVGDDVPDLPVMEKVGVGCCPHDAVPDVTSRADYVSHKNGGSGCAREIIEQVMRVQGKWRLDIGAFKD
jgi:3-deoxy-D-manno-octulosonate 8-phosphate phosphatase (KDO 8-P phosphatase)